MACTKDELSGIVWHQQWPSWMLLDDDLQHLYPLWEIRTPEQMAELDRME